MTTKSAAISFLEFTEQELEVFLFLLVEFRRKAEWVSAYYVLQTGRRWELKHRPDKQSVASRRLNFSLPLRLFLCFLLPRRVSTSDTHQPGLSTRGTLRLEEACVCAAVLWSAAVVSNGSLGRLGHLKYWIRDVFRAEMSNPASSTLYLLQSAMLLYTAATARARAHARSNICRAPTLLASSLMLFYGAGEEGGGQLTATMRSALETASHAHLNDSL